MATQFLNTAEGQLAFDVVGRGPTVICAPGLADVRASYRYLVPRLVEAGFQVVTLDLRGHGESRGDWRNFTVTAVSQDLVALIRHLGGSPVTVIGTSFAAGAAVCAAAEAPELVTALVLIGPFVRNTTPLWVAHLFQNLFRRPWGGPVWSRFYGSLFKTRQPEDLHTYQTLLSRELNDPRCLKAARGMIASSKQAAEDSLKRVTAPSLVIMGSLDPDFPDPAQEARMVAERLGGSFELVEGAGHFPHAEMPDETAGLIARFLNTPLAQVNRRA